jgi:hypothetical protein
MAARRSAFDAVPEYREKQQQETTPAEMSVFVGAFEATYTISTQF